MRHPALSSLKPALKPWLLGLPMALLALGTGALMQRWSSARSDGSAALQAALLAAPTPSSSRSDLDQQSLQLHRAPTTREGVQLIEPAPGAPLDLEIRVALQSQGPNPVLSATGPWWLRQRSGALIAEGAAGTSLSPQSLGQIPEEAWLETLRGDRVLVQGHPYAGRLRLIRSGPGWLVINHLPLEHYIAAVVGAEMPSSWSLEALKAQAVAARSYALAHMARPASRHWHLGDTTRWQAYHGERGIRARSLEAVRQTAGIILSYQGGIVESLYAANQQIVQEAHGGLGASMSQTDAQRLAASGRRYTEILGRFYPGASLARLRSGGR